MCVQGPRLLTIRSLWSEVDRSEGCCGRGGRSGSRSPHGIRKGDSSSSRSGSPSARCRVSARGFDFPTDAVVSAISVGGERGHPCSAPRPSARWTLRERQNVARISPRWQPEASNKRLQPTTAGLCSPGRCTCGQCSTSQVRGRAAS